MNFDDSFKGKVLGVAAAKVGDVPATHPVEERRIAKDKFSFFACLFVFILFEEEVIEFFLIGWKVESWVQKVESETYFKGFVVNGCC